MKHKLKKIMAYFYMPLFFTLLGYGIMYIALAPVFELISGVASVVMTKEIPDFSVSSDSIYDMPSFSADAQGDTVPVSEVVWPNEGQQYGELTCERIGLSTPVFYGDTNQIIRNGAGQYIGSFLPGYGRTILLCAHNTTHFKPLQNVEVGDIFVFTTSYGIYEYEITETQIADCQDVSACRLLQEEEELLVMYTCYPFEKMTTRKTDRKFVYGKRISGPSVVD